MSGLEVAGVVLGAFPLLLSGIEHCRDVAKVGGFFWRIRAEYAKCRGNVQFHEILYKANLKELLIPLMLDSDEITRLISEPGGQGWGNDSLQKRLAQRLHESYQLYLDTITEMNETVEELKKELCYDKDQLQDRLVLPGRQQRKLGRSQSPLPCARSSRLSVVVNKMDYELFRARFSIGEGVRNDLFSRLKECNDRLEKLLSSSDKVSQLQDTAPGCNKRAHLINSAFEKASKSSAKLFNAVQDAWQCSCRLYHFAYLRLEHRTLTDMCFEITFKYSDATRSQDRPWHWKMVCCGHMGNCSVAQKTGSNVAPSLTQSETATLCSPAASSLSSKPTRKQVRIAPVQSPTPSIQVDSGIQLCQQLSKNIYGECMGTINHDQERFHIHPITEERMDFGSDPTTLGHFLSCNKLTRRQRYLVALLVASSVGQLQFTPWLRTGLCKDDIVFFTPISNSPILPYGEPFIRQGFLDSYPQPSSIGSPAADRNFYSLGILLLELCFGHRLQDHPLRKNNLETADAETENAFDIVAALLWSTSVSEEGGDDYATAVMWCFTGAAGQKGEWRKQFVRNVIRPLETCMKHFETASAYMQLSS
jgi:hypothetical protein